MCSFLSARADKQFVPRSARCQLVISPRTAFGISARFDAADIQIGVYVTDNRGYFPVSEQESNNE